MCNICYLKTENYLTLEHLRGRHLDIELHKPHLSEESVTFYLYNLSGQIVGYQQYNWKVLNKKVNDPKLSRYFTLVKQPTIAVWGLESFYLRNDVLFLTEGVFDAARLTYLGFPAIALLSCDPKKDTRNWLRMLNRRVIAVCDNDANGSGRKLAKFGGEAYFLESKDLGDSTDEEVGSFLFNLGFVL
jgi:hypothetical protein